MRPSQYLHQEGFALICHSEGHQLALGVRVLLRLCRLSDWRKHWKSIWSNGSQLVALSRGCLGLLPIHCPICMILGHGRVAIGVTVGCHVSVVCKCNEERKEKPILIFTDTSDSDKVKSVHKDPPPPPPPPPPSTSKWHHSNLWILAN